MARLIAPDTFFKTASNAPTQNHLSSYARNSLGGLLGKLARSLYCWCNLAESVHYFHVAVSLYCNDECLEFYTVRVGATCFLALKSVTETGIRSAHKLHGVACPSSIGKQPQDYFVPIKRVPGWLEIYHINAVNWWFINCKRDNK